MQNIHTFAVKKSTLVQLLIGGVAGLLSLYLVYEVKMVVTLLETSKNTSELIVSDTEIIKENSEQDSASSIIFRRIMRGL